MDHMSCLWGDRQINCWPNTFCNQEIPGPNRTANIKIGKFQSTTVLHMHWPIYGNAIIYVCDSHKYKVDVKFNLDQILNNPITVAHRPCITHCIWYHVFIKVGQMTNSLETRMENTEHCFRSI